MAYCSGGADLHMPELPEVETTMLGISAHVVGHKITGVEIRQPQLRWPIPDHLKTLLIGRRFTSTRRRGKYILLDCQLGSVLIHLGMSGSMRVCKAQSAWKKHDHFSLQFETEKQCRLNDPRRFGAVLWQAGDAMQHKLLATLGPEPLSDEFNADYLHSKCANRRVSIKQHIMNSKIVTGVGNIYASESLFLARIHPARQASRISKKRLALLVASIKTILEAAIAQGGTTLKDFTNADGKPGYFSQQLSVYGRDNEPCLHCKQPLKKIIIGQRSTFYCGRCQR